jgi:hypothetical protein
MTGIWRTTNHGRGVSRRSYPSKFVLFLTIGLYKPLQSGNELCSFTNQAHKVWAKIRRRTADGNRRPLISTRRTDKPSESPARREQEQLMPWTVY